MHKNRRAEQENDPCGDIQIVQNVTHAKTRHSGEHRNLNAEKPSGNF
jgi:hypothetical protein